MGLRKKLKSLFRLKPTSHRPPKPPSPPSSPIPVPRPPPFYQHTNRATLDLHPPKPPSRPSHWEPLEFQHKSYTTASGVVIPPDFSYDRRKPVYQVSGLVRNRWHCNASDDGIVHAGDDDDASDFAFHGDDEASTPSEYSLETLGRMTELALAAHREVAPLGGVAPRPLPETPVRTVGGDGVRAWVPGRGVRILNGVEERRVNGIRMLGQERGRDRTGRFVDGRVLGENEGLAQGVAVDGVGVTASGERLSSGP